jgi:hypothetical protein
MKSKSQNIEQLENYFESLAGTGASTNRNLNNSDGEYVVASYTIQTNGLFLISANMTFNNYNSSGGSEREVRSHLYINSTIVSTSNTAVLNVVSDYEYSNATVMYSGYLKKGDFLNVTSQPRNTDNIVELWKYSFSVVQIQKA